MDENAGVTSDGAASDATTGCPGGLAGRVALVTGVSRRRGIAYAIASRLAQAGASLFISHHRPHDEEQPWGGDDLDAVLDGLRAQLAPGAELADAGVDLGADGAAHALVGQAVERFGHLDALVAVHARSGSDGPLAVQSEEWLDAHWRVNTRSTILLTQAFAAQHDGRPGGRVVWMTSGQVAGPMRGEIAYVASKAALAGMTASVADDLVDRGILLNTVNPGPVNTGYLDEDQGIPSEDLAAIVSHFPGGRFGEPDDPARLVAWLLSDEGRWMVGQVLSTEGGFRRW